RDNRLAAAPLLSTVPVTLVGQEVLAAGEQEGAELPPRRVGVVQKVLLQEPGEELLGQLLGPVGGTDLPAEVGVERIPVAAAEAGQGLARLGGRAIAGLQHDAPVRRGEPPRGGGCRIA